MKISKICICSFVLVILLGLSACGNPANETSAQANPVNNQTDSDMPTSSLQETAQGTEPPALTVDQPIIETGSLLGTWFYMGMPYYVFEEDGTGVRSPDFMPQNFRWEANNGILALSGMGLTEQWDYVIEGSELIITSRIMNMSFIYIREGETALAINADTTGDNAILGTWNWLGMPYYIFAANGIGVRSPNLMPQSFRWTTNNDILTITGVGVPEEWSYTITGNQLEIESRLIPGMSFIYNR